MTEAPVVCPVCLRERTPRLCEFSAGLLLYYCELHGRIITDQALDAISWDHGWTWIRPDNGGN